jgi:hypothetical protein
MADFRKWFMVIAVVLLAAAGANAATQIANIPCTTAAQPPVIRDGGQTEYIGEIDLSCDATQVGPAKTIMVQFTLSVNTVVTNSTVPNSIDGLGPLTMAGLAVQDAVAPQTILFTQQGRVGDNFQNVNNTLRFPHVPLPMGTTFTVRFFNVRVAALPLSSAFGGTEVFAIVAANTENPSGYGVGFTNQPSEGILVAVVQPTYKFAVSDCKGVTATAALQFQQCQDYLLEGKTGVGVQGIQVFGVKFTELQQTAFKNIVQEDGATIPEDGTGICDTGHEGTGYEAVIDDTAGPLGVPTPCTDNAWVSNGTRLLAQFTVRPNLVGKVHIWVSSAQTASSTGASALLATIKSPLGWGNDDASGTVPVSCSNNSIGGAETNNWVQLPDAAVETAAWEVVDDNLGNLDDITFAWTITYNENSLPPLGGSAASSAVTLSGNIAPISTQAVPAPVSLAAEPVVRFALPFAPGAVTVTINDCVTNLLFPYVTNVAGFETGIAISNTSLDTAWNLPVVPATVDPTFGTAQVPLPYNTTPQAGPCDLYLFGSSVAQNMAGAGTAVQAIASGDTPVVSAGQTFADTLTTIFNLDGGKTPVTMSGYVIARCKFQFGHGLAYLVNTAVAGGAPQSYLALIIPDRSVLNGFKGFGPFFESAPVRVAVPFSNSILDEQGEMLAY